MARRRQPGKFCGRGERPAPSGPSGCWAEDPIISSVQADNALTFTPDHSMGAGQRNPQVGHQPLIAPRAISVSPRPSDDRELDSGTMRRADNGYAPGVGSTSKARGQTFRNPIFRRDSEGPTPANAVQAILKEQCKDSEALMAQMKVKKQDVTYPTAGGQQPARIYVPEMQGGGQQQPLPVIAYYHGGGWVTADINTYDASAIALAKKARAIVVSVEYRPAPAPDRAAAGASFRPIAKNPGRVASLMVRPSQDLDQRR